MKVTSIQLEMKDRTKEETLEYVFTLVEKAPPSDLILLPEIWPCGFFCFDRYGSESEPIDGPIVETFQKMAIDRSCYIFSGSFVEREGEALFNTSVLLDAKGEMIARYRKIHLFGYQSEERRILTPGDEVVVATTPWGKAGLATCYDLRFPEFYRKMLEAGAKFFLVASAWPEARLEAWRLFNRARAHENLAFLFSCNCAGSNVGTPYAGHSMFVDPLGKVIVEGGEKEEFISAEVDSNLADSVRNDFPALEDRVFV